MRESLDAEGIAYCYRDGRTRNRGRRIEEKVMDDGALMSTPLSAEDIKGLFS